MTYFCSHWRLSYCSKMSSNCVLYHDNTAWITFSSDMCGHIRYWLAWSLSLRNTIIWSDIVCYIDGMCNSCCKLVFCLMTFSTVSTFFIWWQLGSGFLYVYCFKSLMSVLPYHSVDALWQCPTIGTTTIKNLLLFMDSFTMTDYTIDLLEGHLWLHL